MIEAMKQEPVAWAGYNLDDMCEAFDRVIEEHHQRKNPFHDPVNKDAMIALRILRGFVPHMKRYTTPPYVATPPAASVQEPFDTYSLPGKSLDTHSRTPQRQWVEVEQVKWEGDKLIAKLRKNNGGQA